MLVSNLAPLVDKELDDPTLKSIQAELGELVPDGGEAATPYRPSTETITQTAVAAETLYGGLLSHIPSDQSEFGPQDIADVFEAAIRVEFGDAAKYWQVIVTRATSITVSAKEKIIRIPETREPINREKLRGLIAHEIGVHMLRSVMGEETDTLPLSVGLEGYGASEEGLGKVMEQAVNGTYTESGVNYYLVTGMAQHDAFDFRRCFEIMWRKNLLTDIEPGQEVTETVLSDAKNSAYKTAFRIFRGTDTIAWTKDLSYYNGSIQMWQYFEAAAGDELQVTLSLLGKTDIANDAHRRVVLESRSV